MRADPVSRVERVYREHGDRMWRAMLLYSGDREIASDAVAEAFAQALRRGDQVRSVEKWTWRTAFLVARGMLKERAKHSPSLPDNPGEQPEGMDLLHLLNALSASQRAAVVLHYYGDYPIREVAIMIGSTPAAVGVHLHRARRKLRTLLEEGNE